MALKIICTGLEDDLLNVRGRRLELMDYSKMCPTTQTSFSVLAS